MPLDREKRRKYLQEYNLKNKEKLKAKYAAYYIENKEKMICRAFLWAKANPLSTKKYKAKWQKKNYEKNLESHRESFRKEVNSISDVYIKRLIIYNTKLKITEVPQSLVEIKRLVIQIQRSIKNEQCK